MILPIKFLWEQLDGPQANAISQAIYEYWKGMFDNKLDYFNGLNIETANDAHLTLMGIIANFIRPNILVPDRDYFLFTEHDEHDNPHGLSFINDRSVGGRLTQITGPEQGPYPLDTEFYRALLKTYRDSEGAIDSLVLLDDICNALSLKDNPEAEPSYRFSFTRTTTEVTGRGPGDLYIDMGSMTQWANPLQIYAVLTGLANSVFWPLPRIWTSLDTDIRTHTPYPSVAGGTYGEPVTVELTCSTPGAIIIYTLDGTEPFQEDGLVYTEPILITDTTQLRARAYKNELEPSFEYSGQYIISSDIQLPDVISSLESGTYTGDQIITLSCPFGLPTTIYYTTDGSEPDDTCTEYTGPITTAGNTLIKAKAYRGASYIPSNILTVDARIMPGSVTIMPDIWTNEPLIELSCTTDGVTILYSIDGNTPRTEYTEPFYLNDSATVKAMAIKTGYTDSIISEREYTFDRVPQVVSSMPSGTYEGAQSIVLSCPMPATIIRYTTDGTDPDESMPVYDGSAIIIPNRTTTVIKAKAWKGQLAPSEISTWTYTCTNVRVPMYAIMYDKSDFQSAGDGSFPTYIYESYDGITWTKRLTPEQASYIHHNRINNIIQVLVNGAIETYVDGKDDQCPYFYHVGDIADPSTWTRISLTPYTSGKGASKLCPKGSSTDSIIWASYYRAPGKGTYLKGNNTTEVVVSDYLGEITALRNGVNTRVWGYNHGNSTVGTSTDLTTFTSVSRSSPYWSLYVPELDKFFVNGGGNIAYWDDSTSTFVNIQGLEWAMSPHDRMIYIPSKQKLVYIAVVSKRIFIKESVDGGTTWTTVPAINVSELDSAEGLIAVSYNAYLDRIVVLCNNEPHWGTTAPQYNHTLLIEESNDVYSYEIHEIDSSLAIWSDVGYTSDPLSTVSYDDDNYN